MFSLTAMLATGTRLGVFEILAPLGAGGMGEVYRARDAKLDREVAVKVLPQHLAEDAEALARFEREAKAIAALSHPNILAIHDFGRDGGIVYAVTELLDGETLRERLAAGAPPRRKALEYAAQIARGLAAAHGKGIVHRDLKPENVFVLRDGRVKVLDFGLARHALLSPGEESVSATVTRQTDPGTVLGTVGYMSPEQVRGRSVDHRSDVFSFGAVLYEMLAGQRAFRRESAAETMTAILKEDPLESLPAETGLPPALERILRRCLEKSPDERFQSASDLAFDLETLSGSSGRSEAAEAGAATPWRARSILTPAALLVVGVLGFAVGRRSPSPEQAAPAGLPVSFTQLTFQPNEELLPSLSPDGKTFVYTGGDPGNLDVYFQRVGGGTPINLTPDSPAHDGQPAISPDGGQIAFASDREGGGIFVMGATGESVRRLTGGGYNPAWSPDGRRIVFSSEAEFYPYQREAPWKAGGGQLWTVDLASGEKRQITPGDGDAVQPSWSPNGQRIAYWGFLGGQADLWTIPATGGTAADRIRLTNDAARDWNPTWSADGRSVYFGSDRGGTLGLWRVAVDEASGRALGEPEPLTLPTAQAGFFSVSRSGKQILYTSFDWRDRIETLDFDPVAARVVGPPKAAFESTRPMAYPKLTRSGDWIAFCSQGRLEDLWVVRPDGTGPRQLTSDAFSDRGPSWSADGERILFYSNRSGRYEAWQIQRDGSGLLQLTVTQGDEVIAPAWSPDEKLLLFRGSAGPYLYQIGQPPESARQELTAPEGSTVSSPAWSPDGEQIAGSVWSPPGVASRLAVYRLGDRRYRSFDIEGSDPIWLDGRRLLFWRTGLKILDTSTGLAREIALETPAGAGQRIDSYTLSGDGRKLAIHRNWPKADIWLAILP